MQAHALAKQLVDRFHLQKNFGEALEKFFRHHKRLLKKVARLLAGKALPASKTAPVRRREQERRQRHTQRVRRQKKIWKLFRAGYKKEAIAQMIGMTTPTVYRVLENEEPPAQETRHRPHHITDQYLPYLTRRWNEGCHKARELYKEIVAQG